jgi:hypothetical protein
MAFTRIPTGFENPDDWIFRYNGKDVGRCYRGKFGMNQDGWRWSIYGSNRSGIEGSLEAAEAAFKRAFAEIDRP